MTPLEIVRRACAELGFTPPREGETLAQWASSVLDFPLAPRGGEAWTRAHALLLEVARGAAAHPFMADADRCFDALARSFIAEAREIVRAHGNAYCVCATRMIAQDPTTGRTLCVRCRLRVRGA